MMLDDIAPRIARMCPEDRNQPREDGADQRQKNDCLDHESASLRMILSENRFPLFRIMPNPSSDSRLQPRSSRGCGNRPPAPQDRSPLPPPPPSAPGARTP